MTDVQDIIALLQRRESDAYQRWQEADHPRETLRARWKEAFAALGAARCLADSDPSDGEPETCECCTPEKL